MVVIGGEAKQSEFDVDGQRLVAPQGSNAGAYADYWRELDMPDRFELETLAGGAEKYHNRFR